MKPQMPQNPREWQDAVDAAHGALALDSARQYGLVTGGPTVNVPRCAMILDQGRKMGVIPSTYAIERFVMSWIEASAEACGRSKKRGMTLCWNDYVSLPKPHQCALYRKVLAGYEEAVAEALAYLQADKFHEPAPTPARNRRERFETIEKLKSAVELFNARCPVGHTVTVLLDDGTRYVTKVREPASILGDHTPVGWVDGIAGAYLLSRITPGSEGA